MSANEQGQGVSHASNSALPQKAQEAVSSLRNSSPSPITAGTHQLLLRTSFYPTLSSHNVTNTVFLLQVPKNIEKQVPDSLHDTGSNKETGKVSHATGDLSLIHI